MPVPFTAAGLAVITANDVRVVKTLEIVKELLDSSHRVYVDVSDRVTQWGLLTGANTAKEAKWEMPTLTLRLGNHDRLFSYGDADSIWATLGIAPMDARVKATCSVRLPNGLLETFITYYGRVVDIEGAEEDEVELETRHVVADDLDAEITKWSAGDETQVLGSGW